MIEGLNWLLFTSLFGGFFAGRYFSGKRGGKGKIKSLKFKLKSYKIHLHHWCLSLLILLTLIKIDFYNSLVYGFNIGLVLQGLFYKDFYKLISRK